MNKIFQNESPKTKVSDWIQEIQNKIMSIVFQKKRLNQEKTSLEEPIAWKEKERTINILNEVFPNNYYKIYLQKEITKELSQNYQAYFDLYQTIIPEELEKIYGELANLLSEYYQIVNYLNLKNDSLEKESRKLQQDPTENSYQTFLYITKELEKTRKKLQEIMKKMREKMALLKNVQTKEKQLEKDFQNLIPFPMSKEFGEIFQQNYNYYINMRKICLKEMLKEATEAINFYHHHELLSYYSKANKIMRQYNQAKYYEWEKSKVLDDTSIFIEEYALKYDFARYGLMNQTKNFYAFLNLTPTKESIERNPDKFAESQIEEQRKIDHVGLLVMKIIIDYLQFGFIEEQDLFEMSTWKEFVKKSPYEQFLRLLQKYWDIEEQKDLLKSRKYK